MANGHVKYLLLGGGSAAASAAEAIRRLDPTGDMMLVSVEASRPYHRPPLARGYLRRELRLDDLFTHPSDWYTKNHATLRTHVRALELDLNRRCATLSDSSQVVFDKLLIATGATPKHLDVPGAGAGGVGELPGVMYLRTFEDADRIHNAADVALSGGRGRAVVIGSGLLAAEIAASLAMRKTTFAATSVSSPATKSLAVTLICQRRFLFEGLCGEAMSKAAITRLEKLGVTVHLGAVVTAVEGDGRVQRVVVAPPAAPAAAGGTTSDAVLPIACDFAVVAEGWVPSKDLLRGTSVAAEKAILVDATGRTNVRDVYAAGECAAMFDTVFGKHRVLDHWDVTVSRGLVVGACMAGATQPWPGVTVHRAEVGPTRIAVMGEPRFAERRIVRDAGDLGLAEFAIDRDNRVCAVSLLDWRPPEGPLEALVRTRADVTHLETALQDPEKPVPPV